MSTLRLIPVFVLFLTAATWTLVYSASSAVLQPQEIDAPLQKQAEQIKNEGIKLAQSGQLPTALEKFTEALELYRRAHDPKGEAKQTYNIGLVYSNMGQPQNALKYLNQALPLLRKLGDSDYEANTLVNIALIHQEQGDKDLALQFYLQALTSLQNVADRSKEAQILMGVGSLYEATGNFQQALVYLNRALPLWQGLADREKEVVTLEYIALINHTLGDYQQARDFFERSLVLWKALGNRERQAPVLKALAGVQDNLGQYREALALHNQELSLRQELGDRAGQAGALEDLGLFYARLKDRPKSDEYFRLALQLWREERNPGNEANMLLHLGDNAYNEEQYQSALAYYNQALALWQQAKGQAGEARILNKLGSLNDSLGDRQKAALYFKQAKAIWHLLGNQFEEAYTIRKLALIAIEAGDRQQTTDYLNQTIALSQQISNPTFKAYLLALIGLAYSSMEDHRKALEVYQQAHDLHVKINDRSGEALALSNIGFAYEGLGEHEKALDYYRQSLKIYEQLRQFASIEEIKTGVAAQSAETYQRAVLLFSRLGQPSEAFHYTEAARARSFLDQIAVPQFDIRKKADAELLRQEQALAQELRLLDSQHRALLAKGGFSEKNPAADKLGGQIYVKQKEYEALLTRIRLTNNSSEYASLIMIEPLRLAEVQKLLDGATTLLSYYVTPQKTLAFVITRDSFNALELPVSEKTLRAQIAAFRTFDKPDFKSPAPNSRPAGLKELYTALVAPLKQHLKTPVVGIIPNGILHYLPFAALSDESLYFGDEHALFYLPSVSTLPFIQQKRKSDSNRALVMAQSKAVNLPPLLNADQEARSIARLYNTQPLTGAAATESAFRAQSGDYSILHLAAHGQLNSANPLFSRILLGADKQADGSLEVREIYDLALAKTNLVVLSACVTQLGAQSPGDDIIGLNRAFIYAGTPSVVASLWSVDDEATAYLMTAFYTSLRQGMSKAAALQAAQRKTRQRFQHPYYWSAFVLTGDPGTPQLLKRESKKTR
ncbi:MAG TPA: CHAT domain-containing tetratricopeptide repeat protein [Pyrinomonadaceae bacterium]